jgi:hypothetical protein
LKTKHRQNLWWNENKFSPNSHLVGTKNVPSKGMLVETVHKITNSANWQFSWKVLWWWLFQITDTLNVEFFMLLCQPKNISNFQSVKSWYRNLVWISWNRTFLGLSILYNHTAHCYMWGSTFYLHVEKHLHMTVSCDHEGRFGPIKLV